MRLNLGGESGWCKTERRERGEQEGGVGCENKRENGIFSMEDILQSTFLILGVHWGERGEGYRCLFWFGGADTTSTISTVRHSPSHKNTHTHTHTPNVRPQPSPSSVLNISWDEPMLTNSRPCKQGSLTNQSTHNLMRFPVANIHDRGNNNI